MNILIFLFQKEKHRKEDKDVEEGTITGKKSKWPWKRKKNSALPEVRDTVKIERTPHELFLSKGVPHQFLANCDFFSEQIPGWEYVRNTSTKKNPKMCHRIWNFTFWLKEIYLSNKSVIRFPYKLSFSIQHADLVFIRCYVRFLLRPGRRVGMAKLVKREQLFISKNDILWYHIIYASSIGALL